MLALIGGRDFEENKFNRAIQAIRQPGSSFKPIVYTAAMEHGLNPASVILDQPVTINTPQGEWRPQNYDNTFNGPMTIRRGLEKSVNLVAIQVLMKIGPQTAIEYARRLGLTHRMDAIPSLAVGSCEVVPLELTTAFGAFANQGNLVRPFYIKKIVDKYGKVLEQAEVSVKNVLAPQTAYIMTDMLTGVVRRGTAASIPGLGFNRAAAGKTGTSNDFSDAWFIGFTPQIVCGVWVGVDERRSLGYGITGAEAAIPIWVKAMLSLHRNLPQASFQKPDSGIVTLTLCDVSNKIATPACPKTRDEIFLAGSVPDTCMLHGAQRSTGRAQLNMYGSSRVKERPSKSRRTGMY
ncbi:MAG: penicillin-binding transpeptidase domain-containing protein [Chitinivibrionales bacterium]|nr:penicillin-binding transpeptidase domain-containing protein [Chitinivibrionales bacterium]